MKKPTLAVVILAAGQGTRMKSALPKVLHPLNAVPMVRLVSESARSLRPQRLILVVPRDHEEIRKAAGQDLTCAVQFPPRGTGHALQQAKRALDGFRGTVLVLYADVPLLREGTLRRLLSIHERKRASAAVLTARVADPRGYGRIVRDSRGEILQIVEELDATQQQRGITEINTGVMCFRTDRAWPALAGVRSANAKQEYYLTDVIHLLIRGGQRVVSILGDEEEIMGVNDRVQLSRAAHILRKRTLEQLMRDGVTIEDPSSTFIERGARIGRDTIVRPFSFIDASTRIGQNCVIGPFAVLKQSVLKDKVRVVASTVEGSRLGTGSDAGPYSHLRPGTVLDAGVHVGNFSEIKNSTLGAGTRTGHFGYLGDAHIGAGVNIGAGTVTANFDGKRKHRTVIGRNAFIGSDTTLVAPVAVGARARTGAGSVVLKRTKVPAGSTVAGVPARRIKKSR